MLPGATKRANGRRWPSGPDNRGAAQAGAHGYSDHRSDWQATSEALRRAVDAYNGANQHTKDLYIERIQRESQIAHAADQQLRDREMVLQRGWDLS